MKQQISRVALATAAFLFGAFVCAFALVSTGYTDGPTYRPPARIGAPALDSPFNWTGLYISGGFGIGVTDTEVSDGSFTIDGLSGDGYVGDVRLGLDYHVTNTPFVIGPFVGYKFGSTKFDVNISGFGSLLSAELTKTWYGGARLGYAANRTLWYGAVAYEEAEGTLSSAGKEIGSRTNQGFVYMLGVEHAFQPSFTMSLEYAYAPHEFSVGSVNINPDDHTFMVRGTLRTPQITALFGN